jgi:hypothetical protein
VFLSIFARISESVVNDPIVEFVWAQRESEGMGVVAGAHRVTMCEIHMTARYYVRFHRKQSAAPATGVAENGLRFSATDNRFVACTSVLLCDVVCENARRRFAQPP